MKTVDYLQEGEFITVNYRKLSSKFDNFAYRTISAQQLTIFTP
jgi:hypothetical protein